MEGLDLEDLEGILEYLLEDQGLKNLSIDCNTTNTEIDPGTIGICVSKATESNALFVIRIQMTAVVENDNGPMMIRALNRIIDDVFYELQHIRRDELDILIVGERDKNIPESEYDTICRLEWGIISRKVYFV